MASTSEADTLYDGVPDRFARDNRFHVESVDERGGKKHQPAAHNEPTVVLTSADTPSCANWCIATIAGMLPIAMGLGADPDFRSPMAIAVVCAAARGTFQRAFCPGSAQINQCIVRNIAEIRNRIWQFEAILLLTLHLHSLKSWSLIARLLRPLFWPSI